MNYARVPISQMLLVNVRALLIVSLHGGVEVIGLSGTPGVLTALKHADGRAPS